MLCFDRPRMESPTQTTTIHGYLLPVLHHSTPGVTPHVWWLSHYCISTEWCTPPNYTAKPSSGCVHDITYDGHTGRRRLDCVPLLYLRVADTLTLNSQLSLSTLTLTHMLREYERVVEYGRTEEHTYY